MNRSIGWARHVGAGSLVGLAVLVAMAITACSTPTPSRLFQTDLRPGEDPSYPVVLSDETGLVTRIEPAPTTPGFDYGAPAVRADPTDPNAFILSWGGGPGSDAALFFKQFQGGYLLRLEAHTRCGFFCSGDSALHLHDVRIVTSNPIPIESIVAGGSAN
ncbi:MAG: hypothetical protein ABI573_06865 [Chloroflexota bacterium]